jgi:plasmid stabilization system protein ParE
MPPAFHLILSPEAVANLQAIYDYISKDSPQNAARLVNRILDAMTTLQQFSYRNIVEHQSRKLKYPVRSIVVRPSHLFSRD